MASTGGNLMQRTAAVTSTTLATPCNRRELVEATVTKGLGEIGIVGVAGGDRDAILHATGRRVRDLPITLDKVMAPALGG